MSIRIWSIILGSVLITAGCGSGIGENVGRGLACVDDDACNDDNTCTVDLCMEGLCENIPLCTTDDDCDDADPTTADSCFAGCCHNVAPECPSVQETFSRMTQATFAVVIRYDRGPLRGILDVTIGTAFAVGPHTLATNAHVAEALLNNPWPVLSVLAVQAGTGSLFTLADTTVHPAYSGNPIGSPDVAILTSVHVLPEVLVLAEADEAQQIALGDPVLLTGFPGDVQDLFEITPGTTVPQATALTGTITAFRSFNPNAVVLPAAADIVQHQIPTTPGTSGSPLVRCGKVIGVNNAGTVRLVFSIDEDGNPIVDRQSAASNNFAIHVAYLQGLLEMSVSGIARESRLPPPNPTFAGTYSAEAIALATGAVSHSFTFTINIDRSITGTSYWRNAILALNGTVDPYGFIEMRDNGVAQGFVPIIYNGFANALTGEVGGIYLEGSDRLGIWNGGQE